MVLRPSGSVRRKIPKLGVYDGAHTTAKDSGSICCRPECVCKSTDDIKPDQISLSLEQISLPFIKSLHD